MGGRAVDEGKRERWRKLISEAARSGMSTRAFCRQRGVTEPQFYAWRARLSGKTNGTARRRAMLAAGRSTFALVSDAPGALDAGIELVLADGRRVRIRHGVDEQTLRKVLAAMSPRRLRSLGASCLTRHSVVSCHPAPAHGFTGRMLMQANPSVCHPDQSRPDSDTKVSEVWGSSRDDMTGE